MATNKNQHFVPRCHLKPFTKDEGDAAISLLNLKINKVIPCAPVKNQCSADYIYGQDDRLESAIRFVEGSYGSVVNDLRLPGQVLKPGHRAVLLKFWLLQYMRTEAASIRSMELAAELKDFAGDQDASPTLSLKNAVNIAMHTFADIIQVVDDLKVCVVKNRTSIPFVTSDDPAVLTNRWYLEDARIRGRSFGLSASGALALLPLTPKIALVAYDGDVYSIPHVSGWVETRRESDVLAFNQHQFVNCVSNIFFHDLAHTEIIIQQNAKAFHHRLDDRRRIHVSIRDREAGDHIRYRVVSPNEAKLSGEEALFHSETLHYRPDSWPSFIKWRSPGTVYTNGTGRKYIRRDHALVSNSERSFWRESVK